MVKVHWLWSQICVRFATWPFNGKLVFFFNFNFLICEMRIIAFHQVIILEMKYDNVYTMLT